MGLGKLPELVTAKLASQGSAGASQVKAWWSKCQKQGGANMKAFII